MSDETEQTEEAPRRRRRRKTPVELAEDNGPPSYEEQLEAHLAMLPPVAEGMARAIVTVAGLSVPNPAGPGPTKVVRHGMVFDAPEAFVKQMVKHERCKLI